jgi:D-tyrosyl-tRNA(Tyr) deacylase
MKPDDAQKLFKTFCDILSEKVTIATGQFGASMQVYILNDGPVTYFLDF